MVKYITVKRTNKSVTLEQVKPTKEVKIIRHYHLEQKVEQRHRFKTTKTERENIDINLQRRIEDIKIDQKQDFGSYLKDIVELKRSAISTTKEKVLFNEIYTISQSLPQVLANKQKIIDIMLKFLPERQCTNTVLEMMPYLIKDCREEIFDNINQILQKLLEIINIENVQTLEKCFLLIAYMIKYLEQEFINNFDQVLELFKPYINHYFNSVRKLIAEALAYLIRKNKQLILKLNIEQQTHTNETLAYSIYTACSGIQGYLSNNAYKFIDKVWQTEQNSLIIEFYKVLIQYVSEVSVNVQFLSLLDVFKDLSKRQYINQIYLELFEYKHSNKVSPNLLAIILDQIQNPTLYGYVLRMGLNSNDNLKVILSNNQFINNFIHNPIDINKVLEIALKYPKQNQHIFKLLVAAILQQILNGNNLFYLILDIQQLSNGSKINPESLKLVVKTQQFRDLLNDDNQDEQDSLQLLNIQILCQMMDTFELDEEISQIIKNKLRNSLIKLNKFIRLNHKELNYQSKIGYIEKYHLKLDEQTQFLLSEQYPNQDSLEDKVKLRILQCLNENIEEELSINYLFGRDTHFTRQYLKQIKINQNYLRLGLMSRKRLLRLECLNQLQITNQGLIEILKNIDSEVITLDNERGIKNQLSDLKNLYAKLPQDEQQLVQYFAIGLAFTKFLLLKPQIRDLLTTVIPHFDLIKLFIFTLDQINTESQDVDTEPQSSNYVFDEMFGHSILQASFDQKRKELLFTISFNYLQDNQFPEGNDLKIYSQRRFGNKKDVFFLKLIGYYISSQFQYELFLNYLSKDNPQIQEAVLNNLLQYEILINAQEYHVALQDFFKSLKALVDTQTFRGEMTNIKIDFPEQIKTRLEKYLIYTLYPKIFSKQKLRSKSKQGAVYARRATVLQLFSIMGFENQIVELILLNYGFNGEIQNIPIQVQLEFLKVLKSLIDQMGYQLSVNHIQRFALILTSQQQLSKQSEIQSSFIKELWKVSQKRLAQIIVKYVEPEYVEVLEQVLQSQIQIYHRGFQNIVEDSRNQPSSVLKLLTILTQNNQNLVINNHELMLSKFMELYEKELTEKTKIRDHDGKAAFELNKIHQNKINTQKSVIKELNQIMFTLLKLENLNEVKLDRMEIELDQLGQLFCEKYGEKTLKYLFINLSMNSVEQGRFVIIKNLNILYIFYSLIQQVGYVDQQLLKDALILLIRTVGNPKLYEEENKQQQLKCHLINYSIQQIIQKLDDSLDEQSVQQIFDLYSEILIKRQDLKTRNMIIDIILLISDKFYRVYPMNQDLINLLKQMNSRSNQISQEINYDRCLDALLKCQKYIIELEHNDQNLRALNLVLQNCFYLLSSTELSVRVAVQEVFKQYFNKFNEEGYITKQFIPQFLETLNSQQQEATLKSCLNIFEYYLNNLQVPQDVQSILNNEPIDFIEIDSKFAEFKVLFYDEKQSVADLFFDIQLSKRIKALQILEKKINDISPLFQSSYCQILLPLLEFNIIAKGLDQSKLMTEQSKSHLLTLQNQSISLYGAICNSFNFEQRISILQKLTQKLTRNFQNGFLASALIKLIGSIAENKDPNYDVIQLINNKLQVKHKSELQNLLMKYHEEEVEIQADIQDFEFSYKNLIKQEQQLAKARAAEQKDTTQQLWNQVIDITGFEMEEWKKRSKVLLKEVYHPIKSLFILQKDSEKDKLKLSLSFALTQIIVQLPPDTFMVELNRLIGKLCRSLKSRDDDIRDQGRKALFDTMNHIGPVFLKFILTQLKTNLNQGFENHVLAYTVSHLLEHIKETGQIEVSLQEILEINLDEVLGKVSQEKEEDNLPKKCKEIKSKQGMTNFKTVGRLIDFYSLPQVIGIIDNYISNIGYSHNLQNKLRLIFEHLYLGVSNNTSLPENIVDVVYLMIYETSVGVALQIKEHKVDFTVDTQLKRGKKISAQEIMTIPLPSYGENSIMAYMRSNKLKTPASLIFNYTTLFSLKLLNHQMQNKIDDSPILQKMCKTIIDCLQNGEIMREAVRVISFLIRTFPWIENYKKQLIDNCLQSIQKLSSTDEQSIKDSFSLLRSILDSQLNDFTPDQQKQLINFIELHIEYQEPLECLKSIILQKWQQPAIYDLAIKIRELMLENSKKYQSLCRQIYLNFIIKYPLTPNLLQSHYDFLLANLEYPYYQGRQAIYQSLQMIYESFPLESVLKLADISFFALIVALVKEDTQKDILIECIQELLKRLPKDKLQKYASHSYIWLKSDKLQVSVSGLESLTFLYKYSNIQYELLIGVIEQIHEDWNQWKSQIQASNIQKRNLKNSQWADVVESIQVAQYPTKHQVCFSLMKLLNQFDDKEMNQLLESGQLCKLFKLSSYPYLEAANQCLKLLIKFKDLKIMGIMIKNQEDTLKENMFKILKYYFLQKYIRNSIIIDETLTFEFITTFTILLSQIGLTSLVQHSFDQIIIITNKLLARQKQLEQAINGLINFYKYLLTNSPIIPPQILESTLKIQCITNNELIQEVFINIYFQIIKLYEQKQGSNEFIQEYQKINKQLSVKRNQRKETIKQQAVTDPQEFNRKKVQEQQRKKIQKKDKLLRKRGKIQ